MQNYRKPKKLLLVDDEEGILQLLKDYFQIQSYETTVARTGQEAIEKAILLSNAIRFARCRISASQTA